MAKQITWEPKKVKVKDLIDNPKNPKILNEKGRSRLQKTLAKYGLAGTIICNTDLTIIDGHSRRKELEDGGQQEVWVSVPSRKLTDKEYKEFNAVIDLARAGDPDTMMIEEIIGEEAMDEWDIQTSKEDSEPKEVELKPFKRTHILFSFPPEKMAKLQPLLQKIKDFSFVEYEQSSN